MRICRSSIPAVLEKWITGTDYIFAGVYPKKAERNNEIRQ